MTATPRSWMRPLPVYRIAASAGSAPPANCNVLTPSTSNSVPGLSTTAAFNRAVAPSIVIHDDGIAASNAAGDTVPPVRATRCTRLPPDTESIDVVRTMTSLFGRPRRAQTMPARCSAAACCAATFAALACAFACALACAAANAA